MRQVVRSTTAAMTARAVIAISRDHHHRLRPAEDWGPRIGQTGDLGVAQRFVISLTQHFGCRLERLGVVRDGLAAYAGARCPTEVRPQSLPATATEVFGVIGRKQQHRPAESILRKDAEEPLAEVQGERPPSGRRREWRMFRPRLENEDDSAARRLGRRTAAAIRRANRSGRLSPPVIGSALAALNTGPP